MRNGERLAYKLARPDGWDFYTGDTIQYRGESYPHVVRVPNPNPKLGLCSNGVIHASQKPNDCFVGARIPCSAFRVRGVPVAGGPEKWGYTELTVLEEITDLDTLFGWRYSEAVNPVYPFRLPKREPTPEDIDLLRQWASVWDSVGASVWDSVWASVGDSVWASVGDSVWAYIGSLFPGIQHWRYAPKTEGYPYQPGVDLWRRGLVPTYDRKVWRLHSGEKAEVVWEGELKGGKA